MRHAIVFLERVLLETHGFECVLGQSTPLHAHRLILVACREDRRREAPFLAYRGIEGRACSLSCRRIPMPTRVQRVDDEPPMLQLTLGKEVDSGNHVDRANTPPSVCGDVRAREMEWLTEKSMWTLTGMESNGATPERIRHVWVEEWREILTWRIHPESIEGDDVEWQG